VGVVWIDHFQGTLTGFHGTAHPEAIGRSQSHGCIRLTNWDAARLAQMVRAGTPVLLQE
jgi:lipoprotein-anchoring transpeptidase ErfK/SrfK